MRILLLPEKRVDYETKVKLFIADSPAAWVSSAVVCLYDRDRLSRDDFLGTDVTDWYGEATFRFSARQFADLDERLGGSLPELYVEVFDADGRRVITTRAKATANAVPRLVRVAIPRDLAVRHRLI